MTRRDAKLDMETAPLKNEMSVVDNYALYAAEFCLPVASALALHPQIWKSFLIWGKCPVANNGDAICDGSLQLAYHLNEEQRAA